MFEIILSTKIKIMIVEIEKIVMRKVLTVGFDLIRDHNSYLL